jgi:hypothetical protein
MKKNKSLIALMVFGLSCACVLSCDEQDEKLDTQDAVASHSITGNYKTVTKGRITATDFNGSEGDPIDLATAQNWTAHYRATTNPDDIQAHFFGSEILRQLLDEPGCVGIRMYYAIDDDGSKKLLLVGVDSHGENLLPAANGKLDGGGNIIVDYSYPCPDYCPGNGL